MVERARRAGPSTACRVVIDCANGAASTTAPAILTAAGADVVEVLAAEPDGTQHQRRLRLHRPLRPGRRRWSPTQADAGLAFDGDADRVIAVDETGAVVDGDRLLGLFATDLHRRGRLAGDTVVVTVMTNLGFHLAMAAAGIAVHQTQVGDRYVLEALDAHGWSLGGEQSGHLIFRDLATTGDGVLSGLLLLDLVARAGRPTCRLWPPRSWTGCRRSCATWSCRAGRLGRAEPVWAEVRAVEAELGDRGPGAAPPERDRAAGAGHGRGADRGGGPRRRSDRAGAKR